MDYFKNMFTQWSTWRGLALIGAAVAGVHPDIANAVVNVGDAVISGQGAGVAAVGAIGAYEAFKNERKQDKTHYWKG
ncbi:hypothetical protein [Shewanella fidelis]|uniref:Uncharacterized protein n=1 Tax=Shewanella fidelis TaxID=173509 RepID=A0AAW8NKP8_9GAMM|nr:hypothetical protein [Shewanella fidelis]MDR8523838.1 hypothetical protein [Shewanella fidelis]MDW4810386.1 hypothetical protein [Shewanella fidelis]MDW4823726.1 hypothetical protein [Shewanella fidelis]